MRKLRKFTNRHKGGGSRYPFPEMAARLGTVWEMDEGHDYDLPAINITRAAHAYARRRGLVARTSIPTGGTTVEIMFDVREEK